MSKIFLANTFIAKKREGLDKSACVLYNNRKARAKK